MKTSFSALEIYMSRVFKTIMIGFPCVALCAATTFTVLKLTGLYETVSMIKLMLFDASCVLYTFIGLAFRLNCEDKDGNMKPKVIFVGKIFIAILEFVQWNFISFMIPSRDFWAYSVFFVLLTTFFLDHTFVAINAVSISISIVFAWFFRGDEMLPLQDETYMAEMTLRGVLLLLSFFSMWALTYMVQTRLVKELEKVADYDTLTMLHNRRSMTADLEKAVGQNTKNGKVFSVLMCDLDDFKHINDTYGHDFGDEVLKSVAGIMKYTVGSAGDVYRFGGEEILCLLYLDGEKAVELANRMRISIQESRVSHNGNDVGVTVTVGAAEYENGLSVEMLLKRADANLYYGKNHGKNQVVL